MITTALEKNKNKKPCPDYLKNSSQKKKKKRKIHLQYVLQSLPFPSCAETNGDPM